MPFRLRQHSEGPAIQSYRIALGPYRARPKVKGGLYGCDAIPEYTYPASIEARMTRYIIP